MSQKYKLRKFGPKTERRDYSNTKKNLELSNLINVQKDSFEWFVKEGLNEAFASIYPIISTNGKITIEYLPQKLRVEKPKNEYESIHLAKTKGTTYSMKVYAMLRKIDLDTGEASDQEVLFGEVPLMTSSGSFIVNGSEKVVVSQLVRAPSTCFGIAKASGKLGGKELFNTLEIIPKMGIWIDMYHATTKSSVDFVRVSIDKNRAVSLSTFLRAFGMPVETIRELYGHNNPILEESIRRDKEPTEEDALEALHKILRRGDRITEDSKKNLFANLIFNKRRYNLSRTGRYMVNRKLSIVERITETVLAEDLISPGTNKPLFKKGTKITKDVAVSIEESFKDGLIAMSDIPSVKKEVYGKQLEENKKLAKRMKIVMLKVFQNVDDEANGIDPVIVIGNDFTADEHHLLFSDIVAAVSYYFNLEKGLGSEDDPDSLMNKRVIPIGELLQNQLQIALSKLERVAKERMSSKEPEKITARNITNNKSIYDQFKTFFNTSQLCQFMDQMNPLSEISNKRKVTSLGPGGLNRETAKYNVRDVHSTHYGRICPIETPEGQNIGLILNFANYSRINPLGFIETPYYKVKNGVVDFKKPVFLSAAEEVGLVFAQSNIDIDDSNTIIDKNIVARKDFEYSIVPAKEINYIDVSSKQMTSIASSAIPFLENDDANRALMGANMQRQAVPLLKAEAPLVGTGIEADIAQHSQSNVMAEKAGEVTYVDSEVIKVKSDNSKSMVYKLKNFERSNQGSLITQKPLVKVGDKVKANDLLTDSSSFDSGELAIGKNVLVAFTTWKGYNFEDAIIISERLVKEDVYTSIHIEEKTIEFRKQKLGDDELTNEIPNVSKFSLRNLDEKGIVRVGSEIQAGDVLVGRVSPKGENNPTPEEKLIAAIFSQKSKNIKDTSLKVSHGHAGTVIDVQVLSRENGDKLQDDVSKIIKVYIAQKRKINVGDKMAGRHGNKGVISNILPIEDMPHLEDGTPIDIMLNPQGVPSRMNIGQVLELHLGLAAKALNVKFVTPIFDGISFETINDVLEEAKMPKNGKFKLYDPILGRKFDNEVSVGVMYMLKLSHMIDDKMHARSVGPYSLITQQPLGGKSQNGGQRFGEMETWAVEAYGATNVLQELLTYKSDNIEGRKKVYNSIVSGAPLPPPGTPESFNVLANELRGLGMKLGVKTIDEEGK